MKLAVLAVTFIAMAATACGGGDDGTALGDVLSDSSALAREGSVGGAPAPSVPGAPASGITVVGTGSVQSVPDVSEWSFGVHAEAETAEAALHESSAETKHLLEALRRAGVAKDDLRTQQVSLWPDMREGGNVAGYTASNSVQATVRGMAKAGAIVDAAVGAGANEVWGPSFRDSDARGRFEEAAAAAYDDARRKAEALAEKAGVSLGRPVAITETSGGNVYGVDNGGAELARADVPIEPGKQESQVNLTVTFAIS
jgi:uncharacterized protein